jgi:histidinol-phosphate/aromatic aminotransferase/cobyric acid decarboxylase-like protein
VLEFTNSRIAQKYVDFLYKNKITVRLLTSYGLPNFVRMTIGTKSDMKEAVRVSNKFNV